MGAVVDEVTLSGTEVQAPGASEIEFDAKLALNPLGTLALKLNVDGPQEDLSEFHTFIV